jgi:uncharacterized OsmC-like protein
MVAASTGVETRSIEVVAEGDLDLRGTLGLEPDAAVGFEEIRLRFELDAPEASDEQLDALVRRSERYCVVLQTLQGGPRLETSLVRA